MKTTFKVGQVTIKVKVVDEADVDILVDGVETTFEGTPAEVVEVLRHQTETIKGMMASMNARNMQGVGFGVSL